MDARQSLCSLGQLPDVVPVHRHGQLVADQHVTSEGCRTIRLHHRVLLPVCGLAPIPDLVSGLHS